MAAARYNFFLERRDKGKKEADAAEGLRRAAEDDAQWELANVVPTTFAGVLALLAHLDDLYTGAIALPEDPAQSSRECPLWVKRRHARHVNCVRFTPQSRHSSGRPDVSWGPLATFCPAANRSGCGI
jgi:hypothetical protein